MVKSYPNTMQKSFISLLIFQIEVVEQLPKMLRSCNHWIPLSVVFFFKSCIVDLQHCVSFSCTAKRMLYIDISPVSFRLFSHIGHYRVLSRVPCAIQ